MTEDNHDGEKPNDKGFTKEFKECPLCHSTERYFEGILNELKGRGLIDSKVTCFDFQLQQGMGLSQQKLDMLPFGSEIPSFKRIWDTCCYCGMVYSTQLERATAKKSIAPAPLVLPNRAGRWRQERLN